MYLHFSINAYCCTLVLEPGLKMLVEPALGLSEVVTVRVSYAVFM